MESLFLEPLALSPELELRLGEAAEAGRAHFDKYNQNRLELAFGSFDGAMKEALFDIIYLLHVNDSSLSEITYATTELVEAPFITLEEIAPRDMQGVKLSALTELNYS